MLNKEFFLQHPTTVARGLLGKTLVTRIEGVRTSGVIVETEAYSHTERGCHAFGNRLTPRNQAMFKAGGHAYVYRCYGIHNLFNVVTGPPEFGDAVLIRAIEPREGIKIMMTRAHAAASSRLTSGPGKLTRALGIGLQHSGRSLMNKRVMWVEDGEALTVDICATTRVGIDYAGEDAALRWRFLISGSPWVSKPQRG